LLTGSLPLLIGLGDGLLLHLLLHLLRSLRFFRSLGQDLLLLLNTGDGHPAAILSLPQ
jgi:hypothetical protein